MPLEKIRLSISALVSNRPNTVEKCLSSLDSLRRKVPSELILVDTGCGEQVRKVVEAYGDKIIEFKWCNDFSKARNVGLKQAVGEWFLYLDDDEWFEDTEEIEDFFLSDKHLHYHCGSYLQRNYFNREGTEYRDEYVGRLIRLAPDTKFIYAVHESFSKVYEPRIRLHSYVHHYGYAFQNREEAIKHSRRNISLLLAEHEKNPGQLRHNAQLAQEYNALGNWEQSAEISLQGIKNAGLGISAEQFLGGLYANVVRSYVMLGRYLEAVETGEMYLRLDCVNELAKAAVRYNLCIAYLERKEYAKVLKAVEMYLDFYEKWETDRDATAFFEFLTIPFMSDGCRQAVLCMGVQAACKVGKDIPAKRYFDKIDWKAVQNISTTESVRGMIRVLVSGWLCTDGNVVKNYTDMLGAILKDRVLAEAAEEELQRHLEEVLDGDSFDVLYWSIPYRMHKIQIMVQEEGDGTDNFSENIVQELLAYATENERLCRRLFREELFEEMPELLPRECQVSLKLLDMRKAVSEKDFQRGVSDVRDALEMIPELSDVLKYCTRWISEKSAEQKSEQESARQEMRKLAEAVKGQIRSLVAQGMLAEAAGVLRQFKTLMPGDEEVGELEREIAQQMSEKYM